MSKEPGPREKALREMREAKFAENHQKPSRKQLEERVAVAATKTGKSRKAKR